MEFISRILGGLRERFRRPHSPQARFQGSHTVEDILQAITRRFRAVNPETESHWRLLKIALETDPLAMGAHPRLGRMRLTRPAISFALAVAVLIVAGVVWLYQPSVMTYETAKGQNSTVTLSDSTEVTLNHTTELIVNRLRTENARKVTLKGEAFFRVRRNGTAFIVTTDVATIRVLGTEFNVRLRDDRLEVAVLRGGVLVSVDRSGRDSSVILAAGQIATCTRGDFPAPPEPLPFPEYPAWMHGKFIFYRTSLLSACREIEAQFDVVIRIENPQEKEETITGVVDGRNIESALTTLASLTGNRYRHENNGYTLY